MVLEDDLELSHHAMLQTRANIQNNVISKRKEQLKQWESSEMNKIKPIRRQPEESKVKFQDSDIFLSACVSGDEEEVEDLLSKGANINTSTIDGVTALHQAVIDGNLEIVRFLIAHKADIDAQDNEGWTPLHAAVCCGNLAIVKYLCEKGADLTYVNSDKELAMDLAEDDDIRAYLEELLRKKNIDANECRDREYNVMIKDCTEWIRTGKYLDKPHSKTGATALHVAASKGYNHLVGLLIRSGADVHARDFEGWTPLHAAAHWGEKEACRHLMEKGANLDEQTMAGHNVLRVADKAIVEYLEELQNKISQETNGKERERSVTSNVLQQTNNNTVAHNKRSSVTRMNSEEKLAIKKKDEHDENVSLSSTSNVIDTTLKELSTPPSDPDHSLSPPPTKKQETEVVDAMASTSSVPATDTSVVFRSAPIRCAESPGFESGTPTIAAVLPAPRNFSASGSSISTSGSHSSISNSVGSSSETPTTSESSDRSASDEPPKKVVNMSSHSSSYQPNASSSQQRTPSTVENGVQKRTPSEEEQSVVTVSSRADSEQKSISESNTGSSISSIHTTSRSVTSKEASSSLYSSDQEIECTVRVERPSPSTASTKPLWSQQQAASGGDGSTSSGRTPQASKPNTSGPAPLARVTSPSASSSSSASPIVSPSATATVMFRKPPPIASNSNVQRSASASSNAPWVNYFKPSNGSVPLNVRNITATSAQTAAAAANKPPISSAPSTPNGFRPCSISRPIQPSTAYTKYSAQIARSWQTPPTQPAPQKESEAERKAKSRLQRASRRSTQGVTLDQLNEARAASEDLTKWKSSTLQQQQSDRTATDKHIGSSENSVSDRSTSTDKTAETAGSVCTSAHLTLPTVGSSAAGPSPSTTPSAAKLTRRSQMARGNRRGTGPVDPEALSAATTAMAEIGTSDADDSDSTLKKVTRVSVPSKEQPVSTASSTEPSSYAAASKVSRGIAQFSSLKSAATSANGTAGTVESTLDGRYKVLYEKELEENERLRKRIEELDLQVKKNNIPNGNALRRGISTSNSSSSSLSEQERRSYERKIAELEYELEKTTQLQSDFKRLKDENSALIRVISKLSK